MCSDRAVTNIAVTFTLIEHSYKLRQNMTVNILSPLVGFLRLNSKLYVAKHNLTLWCEVHKDIELHHLVM